MGVQEQSGGDAKGLGAILADVFRELRRELKPVAAPTLILVATLLATLAGLSLPASLAGLKSAGPYFLLTLAASIAVWFNRGRAFIAATTLLGAFAAYSMALALGPSTQAAQAVFAAVCLLVPINIMLTVLLAEQGFFHRQNYRWLLLALMEIVLLVSVASAGSDAAGADRLALLDHWLLRSPPTPIAARALFVLAFTIALMRAWPKPPATEPLPLDTAMVSVLIAFFFACEWAATPGAYSAFVSAAGVLLLLALLQESYRLAFRDDLTGLPGRRALDERLRGLDKPYALAMVDVDYFKQFNDTHGHAIGDQVLKLVAARLAEVSGGGMAYRYGGEEFVVLFPELSLEQAEPHLEKSRYSIEGYKMAVRAPDRPRRKEEGAAQRREHAPDKTLSVTVSMGLAECTEENPSAALVMKAADEALYRAKSAGRNKLSR